MLNKKTTSKAKSITCKENTPMQKSLPTSAEASTGKEKDLTPYWNDYIKGISSRLWLPTKIGSPGSDSNFCNNWSSVTGEKSWFAMTKLSPPNKNLQKIFSPSSTFSVVDCTASAATKTQSKKIRIYPNKKQKQILQTYFDASRWYYNKAIEYLKETGEPANWIKIRPYTLHCKDAPERLKNTPHNVRNVAVRDACRAMSAVKKHNAILAEDKKRGLRAEEFFAELHWRKRKTPKQSCYVPVSAIKERGVYVLFLGEMNYAESLPNSRKAGRITFHNGRYYISVTVDAQQHVSETQARVVALDPGIRNFLTWYSEEDAGFIGANAFGRIQRLCVHLDDLLSRAKKCKLRFKKRNMYKASDRMRWKIGDLIDELHHQVASFLVKNYDLIIIPTFETADMSRKNERKIRSKSVRNMLTFAHYRFKMFLIWKAWQYGKSVMVTNEAYTSKTCSWSGEVIDNLGGRKMIKGSDGVVVDRDINGARGIFLRALGDSPKLAKN